MECIQQEVKNMENINPQRVGVAVAITGTVASLACALLVWILPQAAVQAVFSSIFHGVSVSVIDKTSMTLGNVLLGLVSVGILGYVLGLVYAYVYNWIGKRV